MPSAYPLCQNLIYARSNISKYTDYQPPKAVYYLETYDYAVGRAFTVDKKPNNILRRCIVINIFRAKSHFLF